MQRLILNFTLATMAVVLFAGFLSGDKSSLYTTEQHTSGNAYTSYVDPFIGTNKGNLLPGAFLPLGLMRLSPDVTDNRNTNGYHSDKKIMGFSHTHTSGTGGPTRYGNFRAIPQCGVVELNDFSTIYKSNEYAKPGYYRVHLASKQGLVKCELTATQHVGVHRYSFHPKQGQSNGNILIDVSSTIKRSVGSHDARCDSAVVDIHSSTEVSGHGTFSGGWGGRNPYTIYFFAQFSQPCKEFGTWSNGKWEKNISKIIGNDIGAFFSFDATNPHQKVMMKLGISLISKEQAKSNIAQETPSWSFDDIRMQADSVWNSYLSKIDVTGGTPEQRVLFYTALRNSYAMPTDITHENPLWKSDKPAFWDFYCIWDVFRTTMPLYTLITPNIQRDIVNSLLDIYQHKGWLPDAWIAGDYAAMQGGSNADVVMADAIVKGVSGIDTNLILQAVLKNGTVESDKPKIYGRYLSDYLKYGYVTTTTVNGASSRTLEYAYNDYCIAQIAKAAGKPDVATAFEKQSQRSLTLFHPAYKYFWGKDTLGNWMPDFSKHSLLKEIWLDPYFYEGGSETYSSYFLHDMQGLINLHGGNEQFAQYLDSIFDSGRFQLFNEPLFLLPYQYNYCGKPDKTAEHVRNIMAEQFLPSRDGYPGDDDAGALSAWYVFSAMGLFPVAGQDIYLIGSPIFDKIKLEIGCNRYFEIEAVNNSNTNIYVQEAYLNGKRLNQAWLRHNDIVNGKKLVLIMSDKPSDWGRQNPPPSLTKE